MWLLDGNVLVALAIDTHEFHERVQRWFDSQSETFATCAITEGTLLRVHIQLAEESERRRRVVRARGDTCHAGSCFLE